MGWLMSAGLVLGAGAVTAMGETVEEIEKKLTEAYAKMTSYSAKVKTDTDMDMGDSGSSKSHTEGTMEWMRKGDKVLMRMDMKMNSVTKVAGQEIKMDGTTLMICDGDFTYTVTDMAGQKSAMKAAVDPNAIGDVKNMFALWKKDYELKVLPDAKAEGEDCYVIEATPKSPGAVVGKMQASFSKKNGMSVRMVSFDAKGKQATVMVTTDIKLGAALAADRFVFKAPEGVQVMDMTKQKP
ncbi:MAG: outer membrane lipoprotein carrier protein LolA [Phycisphaerales bacterium]|nr:outer membrane lipoprotein carrier protein LolA [Phycisphaerales bacterium]